MYVVFVVCRAIIITFYIFHMLRFLFSHLKRLKWSPILGKLTFKNHFIRNECDQKFVSTPDGPLNGSFYAPTLINHEGDPRQCVYTFLAGPRQRVELIFTSFGLRGKPPDTVGISIIQMYYAQQTEHCDFVLMIGGRVRGAKPSERESRGAKLPSSGIRRTKPPDDVFTPKPCVHCVRLSLYPIGTMSDCHCVRLLLCPINTVSDFNHLVFVPYCVLCPIHSTCCVRFILYTIGTPLTLHL
ncbi:hypothetical protein P5V15_001033 [Pogonomyrmex californicus]